MRNRLLVAIMAATLLLHPGRSHALAAATPNNSRTDGVYLVVEQILVNRGRLALTEGQVSELTALADRLRHHRGRTGLTGYDRVPGKSVPQIERIRLTSADARRLAFRDLTPEQRRIGAAILDHSERTDTAQR